VESMYVFVYIRSVCGKFHDLISAHLRRKIDLLPRIKIECILSVLTFTYIGNNAQKQ